MVRAKAAPFSNEEVIGFIIRRYALDQDRAVEIGIPLTELAEFRRRFVVKRSGRDLKNGLYDTITVTPRCPS